MLVRYPTGTADVRWSQIGSDVWEGRYRNVESLIDTFLVDGLTIFDVFNDEAFWAQLVFCDHVRGG